MLTLRATVIDYPVIPNTKSNGREVRTIGVPDSRIRFRVESILKGPYSRAEIVLPGYVNERG